VPTSVVGHLKKPRANPNKTYNITFLIFAVLIIKFNTMAKKIKESELKSLRDLNTEFTKIKSQLGDTELQKYTLLLRVQEIKTEFQVLEKNLAETYGKDTIISMETGEVKPKPKDGENK